MIAFKIAGGFDYFLNSNIALNPEIGWKGNSGKDKDSIDFNVSGVAIVLGIRYYFDK